LDKKTGKKYAGSKMWKETWGKTWGTSLNSENLENLGDVLENLGDVFEFGKL